MSSGVAVRAAGSADLASIRGLAVESGLFAEDEAAELFTSVEADDAALWLVAAGEDGGIVGATYVVAEPVSDRVWNMLFLAVSPAAQGEGVGTALVSEVEHRLGAADRAASALVVETSSGDAYAPARAFYVRLGFEQVGQVPRYYGPGEDKVVLWKALAAG